MQYGLHLYTGPTLKVILWFLITVWVLSILFDKFLYKKTDVELRQSLSNVVVILLWKTIAPVWSAALLAYGNIAQIFFTVYTLSMQQKIFLMHFIASIYSRITAPVVFLGILECLFQIYYFVEKRLHAPY
jgi:hypothetical protein